MTFTPADLRYMSDACLDEGAIVYDWQIEEYADELEGRYGREPSEEEVIEYAVSEYARRIDDELGSLAKFNTAAF